MPRAAPRARRPLRRSRCSGPRPGRPRGARVRARLLSGTVRRVGGRRTTAGGCHPTGATIAVRAAGRGGRAARPRPGGRWRGCASTATRRSASPPGSSTSTSDVCRWPDASAGRSDDVANGVPRLVPPPPGHEVGGVPQTVSHASSRTATRWSKVCSASVRARAAARIASVHAVSASARRHRSVSSSGVGPGEHLGAGLVEPVDVGAVDQLDTADAGGLEGAHREAVLVAVQVERRDRRGHEVVGLGARRRRARPARAGAPTRQVRSRSTGWPDQSRP